MTSPPSAAARSDDKIAELIQGKRLAFNTVLNMAGYAAPLAVAALTIPAILRGLGAERFGVLTLCWIFFSYIGLLDLGLSRALTKVVAERLGAGRIAEIPTVIQTALLSMFALGVLIAGLITPALPVIIRQGLNIPPHIYLDTLKSFQIMSLFLPFLLVSIGFKGILDAHQRFDLTNLVRIPFGVYTFVSPLLVLPFFQNLYPMIVVFLVGRFIMFAVQGVFCQRVVPSLFSGFTINPAEIGILMRFGGWMTVSNVINPIIVYFDRFLISALISITAVAYYATPSEIVTKLLMISGALINVLFPAFSTGFIKDRNHTARLFQSGLNYLILIMFPPTLIIALLAAEGLSLWLGVEFSGQSAFVLKTLSAGVFVLSLGQLPCSMIQGVGRPDLTAKLHLIELPVYLILLTLLIKAFGINGAALAWLIRNLVDAIILFVLSAQVLTPPEDKRNFKALIIFTGVSFAVAFGIQSPPLKIIFLIVDLGTFFYLAWRWILSESIRGLCKSQLRRWLSRASKN